LKAKRRTYPYLFFMPLLLYVFAFGAFPLAYGIYLSLTNYDLDPLDPKIIGFQNYAHLLNDVRFWSSLKFTITYTVAAVVLTTILGMTLALALSKVRHSRLYKTILVIPFAVVPIVSGSFFRIMLTTNMGLIYYLDKLLGQVVNPLNSVVLAPITVILIGCWLNTPFCMLCFSGGLQSLPVEPIEAARMDGASSWRVFTGIILPMLKPVMRVVLLFNIFFNFSVFDIIVSSTRGGPSDYTWSVSFLAVKAGFSWSQLAFGSAASLVLTAISACASMIVLITLREK
jgi:multiple sugar transport system permease protein